MNKKESQKQWDSMRIDKTVLEKLRKNKAATGIPIATFVERAVDEKLEREKEKK